MRLSDFRTTLLNHLATTPATGDPSGSWEHSGFVYDVFPIAAPREGIHLRYSIGILDTEPATPRRQRPTEGMPANTRIGVRWAYRIRKDEQSDDYQDALIAEQVLLSHLLLVSRTDGVGSLYVERIFRITIDDGVTFFGEVTLRALHLYDLL